MFSGLPNKFSEHKSLLRPLRLRRATLENMLQEEDKSCRKWGPQHKEDEKKPMMTAVPDFSC